MIYDTTSPKQPERSKKMRAALDKKRFGPWALVTGASSGNRQGICAANRGVRDQRSAGSATGKFARRSGTGVALYLNRRLRSQVIHDLNTVNYCT
jgi:hypothetical protein